MTPLPNTPQDYGHPEDTSEDERRTHTETTAKKVEGADVEPDIVSDPSRNVREGSDWTDEGGASPDGPATAESSSNPSPDAGKAAEHRPG